MDRVTRQRQAIQDVIESAARPLTPQEILVGAQHVVPRLGVATVYRALNALVAEERLVVVGLPGEAPRYEVAGREHHHHFRCGLCERVFEVNGCVPNVGRLAPRGFRVQGHEVILYGLCAACAQPRNAGRDRRRARADRA